MRRCPARWRTVVLLAAIFATVFAGSFGLVLALVTVLTTLFGGSRADPAILFATIGAGTAVLWLILFIDGCSRSRRTDR